MMARTTRGASSIVWGFVFIHVADGFGDVVVIIADGQLRAVTAPSGKACAVFPWTDCSLPRTIVSQRYFATRRTRATQLCVVVMWMNHWDW